MKKILGLIIVCIVIGSLILVFSEYNGSSESLPPDTFTEADIEVRGEVQGVSFVVVRGDIYEVMDDGSFEFREHYYDPNYKTDNYEFTNDAIYRIDKEKAIRIKVGTEFSEGFEKYRSIQDMITGEKDLADAIARLGSTIAMTDLFSPWNVITLQSAATPEVVDSVRLRNKIEIGEASFIDNRVEPSQTQAHTGKQSLMLYSVAPSWNMVTAKASMHTEAIHFEAGDDVWFSAWYYIEEGLPFTIMDLESTYLYKSSGIRIAVDDQGHPFVELKAFSKPSWRQSEENMIALPIGKWVNVKTHFTLDQTDGLVELWIDGKKVVVGRGQTLPLQNAIYNKLEVGISATQQETRMYVDDVKVSKNPL